MKDRIKVKIVNYRFDISKEDEATAYSELVKIPESYGYTKCASISSTNPIKRTIPEDEEKIETKQLFSNQYNTMSGKRIFDWQEHIFPNKDIKDGYYIEYNEELQQAKEEQYNRENQVKFCGFCGKQYKQSDQDYCGDCLSSKYLDESNLYLVELIAASNERKHKRNKVLPQSIVDQYNIKRKEKQDDTSNDQKKGKQDDTSNNR